VADSFVGDASILLQTVETSTTVGLRKGTPGTRIVHHSTAERRSGSDRVCLAIINREDHLIPMMNDAATTRSLPLLGSAVEWYVPTHLTVVQKDPGIPSPNKNEAHERCKEAPLVCRGAKAVITKRCYG
jgi:hypothetical protein